jgi:hypothetical protein
MQCTDSTSVEIERQMPEGVTFEVICSGTRLGAVWTEAVFTLNDHQMDCLVRWWAERKGEK